MIFYLRNIRTNWYNRNNIQIHTCMYVFYGGLWERKNMKSEAIYSQYKWIYPLSISIYMESHKTCFNTTMLNECLCFLKIQAFVKIWKTIQGLCPGPVAVHLETTRIYFTTPCRELFSSLLHLRVNKKVMTWQLNSNGIDLDQNISLLLQSRFQERRQIVCITNLIC